MNVKMQWLSAFSVMLAVAVSSSSVQAFDLDFNKLNPLKKKEEKTKQKMQNIEDYEWCGTKATKADVEAARSASKEPEKAEAEARETALVEKNKKVVKCMISSLLRVAEAQSDFAEALGAKDQADKLRAESEALKAANYSDEKALQKHVNISKQTNKIIREKIAQKQELNEEGRKQFVDGLLDYAVAVRETKETTDALKPYYDAAKAEAKQVQAIYSQSKNKQNVIGALVDGWNYLKVILGKQFNTTKYLVKKGRGLMDDHKKTLESVVTYAKDNKLKVPKEVEATMVDFV